MNNMLDNNAVGMQVAAAPWSNFTPGFLRRHWASNLHALAHPAPSPGSCLPKFQGAANCSCCGNTTAGGLAFYIPFQEPSAGGSRMVLLNKNKFQDHLFSENGERSQQLLHLQQQQKGGGDSQINSIRFKTELCRPFQESGTCKYGEKCQFAHGFQELRSVMRHPRYKTERCRTFHTIGFCYYGPRCHFIHNEDKRRPVSSGDLCTFGARHALHLGFLGEPRPMLHHSLCLSGFRSGHHQPQGGLESQLLLSSPTSHTPLPPSCSLASAASTPSGDTACCASAAPAAAAALLFGTGETEDLSVPGALCAACTASYANNTFAFGRELSSVVTPVAIQINNSVAATAAYYRSQQQGLAPPAQPPAPPSLALPADMAALPSPPFNFQLPRRVPDLPVLDALPRTPDSLSYRDGYLSGSESPNLNPGRRLPIFSCLSVSDD